MDRRPIRTLKDLDDAGLDIRVWCYSCQRTERIDSIIWEDFVAKGWAVEIEEARKRFKCKKCRTSKNVLLVAAKRPKQKPMTTAQVVEAIFFHHRSKRLFRATVEERR